jgi:hypothetical protein
LTDLKMLFDTDRHEPLSGAPWDPAAARLAIQAIVADTRAAFTPEGLWPVHPDDGPPEWGAIAGLYFGAAGVVWALDHLARRGAVADGPAFEDRLDDIEARNDRFIAIAGFGTMAPGYLLARTGVLLALWRLRRDPAILARLAQEIAANSHAPALELMWGAPGTMLIAEALHRETGEARWADLFRAGAAALEETFRLDPQIRAHLWTQTLYGASQRYIGAVHGFAGNACVLNRGRDLLEKDAWRIWSARIAETLDATAVREGDLVNWPAQLGAAADGRQAPMLVQHCHGAPGMVTSLAGLDAPIDALLIAAGELTWRAGPLRKGSNLCHGTGGNGYAFLKLFERTGDQLWLDRARAFAMHAIGQSEAQAQALGRRRYSLWTGDLGLACYLWDCIEARARFPTLDVL